MGFPVSAVTKLSLILYFALIGKNYAIISLEKTNNTGKNNLMIS